MFHESLSLNLQEIKGPKSKFLQSFELFIAYTPFINILLGTFGNTATLYFISRSKILRQMSSMIILIFVSIVDTLSLFTWNLDHFYYYYHHIYYETLNIYLCRIMTFIQYFSLQSSGFLTCLLTIDRFITLSSTPGSFYSKLPFSSPKSVATWSIGIITFFFLLNIHILFFYGYFEDPPSIYNQTISIHFECNVYSTGFQFHPIWDQLNIFLYSFVPSFIMLIFNLLIISKLKWDKNSQLNKNDKILRKNLQKKRNLTLSLLAISFLFLICTLPAEFFYGYLKDYFTIENKHLIGSCLDFFSFLNHSTLFYTLLFSYLKFRQIVCLEFKRLFGLFSGNTIPSISGTNRIFPVP